MIAVLASATTASCSLIVDVGDLARSDADVTDSRDGDGGPDSDVDAADADGDADGDGDAGADADESADGDVDGGGDTNDDADADSDFDGDLDGDADAFVPVTDCTGYPDFTPCILVTTPTDYSYDICSGGTCVSPGTCGDATCNAPGPNWTIPDTNQRLCYNDGISIACPGTPGTAGCETTAFCGEDAQYGWDVTCATCPRFARTSGAEPVVVDNVTGLLWIGCSAGQTGDSCTSTATALIWRDALTHCDGRSWGGYSDWRLPNRYDRVSGHAARLLLVVVVRCVVLRSFFRVAGRLQCGRLVRR
jgi:hypothetical protein